jgi:hypothetical protein
MPTGHKNSQYLFFFQYLHCGDDPEKRPPHPELRSFTVATLKLVDLVKDLIARASVFEEEDFQPLTYGFHLANDITESKAMSALKESEDSMQKIVRATKTESDGKEHKEAVAIFARIKFYRHFYLALAFLAKQDVIDSLRLVNNL